jgi:hypothetical protein
MARVLDMVLQIGRQYLMQLTGFFGVGSSFRLRGFIITYLQIRFYITCWWRISGWVGVGMVFTTAMRYPPMHHFFWYTTAYLVMHWVAPAIYSLWFADFREG